MDSAVINCRQGCIKQPSIAECGSPTGVNMDGRTFVFGLNCIFFHFLEVSFLSEYGNEFDCLFQLDNISFSGISFLRRISKHAVFQK